MTTYALKTTFILFIFTVLLACNKEEALPEEPITGNPKLETNISGAVLLPAGSAIDVNSLNILSPMDMFTITDGTYEITTLENEFLTLMVTDENGEVILMGYAYPEQTDFEINSTSTVLAILMNMPISLVLEKKAKRELITLLLNDSNFKQVVTNFEKTLLEGTNPLETSNTFFAETIDVFYRQLLFPEANKSAKLDYSFDPVDVRVTNNEITFVNLGKTYETVIGIYKDDVKIENINVERVTFIPTTVGDAIGAFASAYGGTELSSGLQPVEYTYTFENEGQYDIKIRTSKLVDDAIENDIALLNNITNWGVDLILEILPLGDCVQPIIADFKQHAQTFGSFPDATTEQEKLGLLYDVLYTFFNQTKTLITCLGSAEELEDYLKKFGTVLKFVDLIGKIGNGGNILLGITQLVADEGKMDLCYNVSEGVASECAGNDVYIVGFSRVGNGNQEATIWKNGVATVLSNGSNTDGSYHGSFAESVYVSGTDVYVVGYETYTNGKDAAKLWKNGVVTSLTDGNALTQSRANSVYISENNIYIAGYESFNTTLVAKLWKNGEAISLTDGGIFSEAYSVHVYGNDVYVSGVNSIYNENMDRNTVVATIWKNGVATSLTDGTSFSSARSVYVSGSDVYVSGSEDEGGQRIAKVWKNGVATFLTDSNNASAESVYVSGSDVYVAGFEDEGGSRIAKVWRNGVANSLTDGTNYSVARSVYVSSTDIYVVGYDRGGAKLWKNGMVIPLTEDNAASSANSVFVKE